MRLIPRHRYQQRHRKPAISITEDEISADLHYPASRQPRRTANAPRQQIR